MIKIGIESVAYFDLYDYEQGLKRASSHGYDCIDYCAFYGYREELHSIESKELEKYFFSMAQCAKENGLQINQMHASGYLNGEKELSNKIINRYIEEIKCAKALTCESLVFHPHLWQGASEPDEVIEVNERFFRKLLPVARDNGVVLCVENLPFIGHKISSVSEIKRLLSVVGDDHLKICFDTGHSHVIGADIYEDVVTAGDSLRVLHVHDDKYRQDRHLMPYQGQIDWEAFIKGLNDIDFNGVLSLETSASRSTPEPICEKMQLFFVEVAKTLAKRINEKQPV